ncbi:hypothetical protein CFC21_069076 [Triticum aestivum]|uniref:Knottins-like domain-containing protein n=2 Tax=Triticum aestivum TaxID=4565 RepID=A0A9R1KQC4_WHEAT|nr:hypothetical protein CFC21_069076 [Triticum aestivum]
MYLTYFSNVWVCLCCSEVAPAQAVDCRTASTRFNGICILDTSCANMCITEGFLAGGECEGLHRRCMCRTPC